MSAEKFSIRFSTRGAAGEGRFGGIRVPRKGGVDINLKPFTVFIGPQGSGKSLVSQFVYFLRNWKFLIAKYGEGGDYDTPDALVQSVANRLRSGPRAIAGAFIESGVHHVTLATKAGAWGVSLNPGNRKVTPLKPFRQEIEKWLEGKHWRDYGKRYAAFVPAERIMFARFINTPDESVFSSPYLPVTMNDFARLLRESAESFYTSSNDLQNNPDALWLHRHMEGALRGHVRFVQFGRFARRWQWVPLRKGDAGSKGFEIEMASSGQMAGWPLYQVLMDAFLRSVNYPEGFAFHVEEPENHLHPQAQAKVVEALVYMVNKGYRVLVTTHSLTIIRSLNAAMQRFIRGARDVDAVQINPKDVGVYHFNESGDIVSIVSNGFVDESHLGDIDDSLGSEIYTLWYGSEEADMNTDAA